MKNVRIIFASKQEMKSVDMIMRVSTMSDKYMIALYMQNLFASSR